MGFLRVRTIRICGQHVEVNRTHLSLLLLRASEGWRRPESKKDTLGVSFKKPVPVGVLLAYGLIRQAHFVPGSSLR